MINPQNNYNNKSQNTKKCVLDIETSSFLPWQGRLVCIGTKNVYSGEIRVFQDEHEEAMLIQFFQYFNKNNFSEIIGFNISFDMRFIFAKCIQYKIQVNGFFSIRQTDLMMILKNVNGKYSFNQPGTLENWAQALLGKNKLFHNLQIPDLYREGKIQDIIEYNIQDLELTYELWKRINLVMAGENYKR